MQKGTTQRLDHIDALRGLAFLGVIAIHTTAFSAPFSGFVHELLRSGSYGVQLFYVISAFTLFLSMSIRKEEETGLLNFFIRRFFRIAPLFYCAVVFYLCLEGTGPRLMLGDAPAITPLNILATFTFTNGWNPYWINSVVAGGWSIAIEMMFYLMVPFLFKKIRTIESAALFALLTLFASVVIHTVGSKIQLISDRVLWEYFLGFWLPNQLPIFALGFVLFFIFRALQPNLASIENKKGKAVVLLTFTAYLILALPFGTFRYLPSHVLYAITFVILTIALTLYPFKFIVNDGFKYLGKISYSAYLTHRAVLILTQWIVSHLLVSRGLFTQPRLQYGVTFILALGGTVVVSTLTHRFIEMPGQNLGRQLVKFLEARRLQKRHDACDLPS